MSSVGIKGGYQSDLPTVTIAICTYNGSETLTDAISSLRNLDYPENKIELFLVDDGSTDNTSIIAEKAGLRVYRHNENQGLAAARNTALSHATGHFFVSFDDDLRVDRRWLKSIVRALMSNTNAEVLGVCGRLQSVGRGVVARYFAAQGHGMPTAVRMNIDQPIVLRLFAYMYTRLVGPHMPADGVEVREVPGGNAVFESELLKKVHGWDSNLKNAAEDNDLCRRLKHVRPNGVFLYCGGATIRHHDNISVSRLILRARTRGKVAAQYYSKHNVFPPIFPFPVLVIAILTVPFIYLSAWTLLLAICSPIIVYFWWLFRAFKESTWELMLFSYIEFLEQFFSNIGILQFSVLKIVNKRRKIRDI